MTSTADTTLLEVMSQMGYWAFLSVGCFGPPLMDSGRKGKCFNAVWRWYLCCSHSWLTLHRQNGQGCERRVQIS